MAYMDFLNNMGGGLSNMVPNTYANMGLGQFSLPDNTNTTPSVFEGVYAQPQSSFLHEIGNMFGGLGHSLGNTTSHQWANYGSLAGALGGLGLGYMNYKNGQKMQNLYKQQMDFNRNQILEDKNRFLTNQKNLTNNYMHHA